MKKYVIFVLNVIVLFSITNVYAEEAVTEIKTVEDKVGWVTENGNTYYYENNQKVSGFKTIDNKLYFFSRVNYALKKGWQNAKEGKWYQNSNGEVVKGLQTIDKNKYYFNDNGIMQRGFQEIGGKLYFFSRVNGILKTGWQNASEGYWYQNSAGEVVKGLQTIGGKKYYFNEKGIEVRGFQEIGGKLYFFSRVNGVLKTGWQNASEGYWYQNSTGEVVKGLQTIGGKKYYFNNNGIMQKGFVTIDGKRYFFSRVNGVLKTGWQNASEGYWYQDSTGALVTGAQTIDGRDYKFNEQTGLLDGFKIVNGKTYYYNPDGTQAKGVQYMANRFWYFDELTGAFVKYVKETRVIDVSAHQGVIDWNAVKASGKVDAVILRLGYGVGYMDKYFIRNKDELERLGIPYSVYLFSYAENKDESLRESDFLVKVIQQNSVKIASNIFSIYYDLEDWEIKSTGENSYGISKSTYKDMITTFVNNTEKKLCIKTRVYASKNYIEDRFPQEVQHYATWVAQWSNKLTYEGPFEGWQYTDCASIPGINGCVDMSKFYY